MNLKYDIMLTIAVGASRKETHWRTTELMWSQLVERLSKTTRTSETMDEYAKGSKEFQDSKKDVGGFVGGTLTGGRRKSGSVISRSLITLDIDTAKVGFFENFCLVYDNAAQYYSTHKHTPEKPRYRLSIPTNRPMKPDEYEPVARRIASTLGIDQFDDSTFEPERLMYWPSTSKDGVFETNYQDGALLNVDEILATYHDYHDTSEWPVSNRQETTIRRDIKKLGDPTEKKGLVGAFCRTYDIYKAIATFLPNVYDASRDDKRFTYHNGSTANGLIVYEDGKFAYSHHGTDPAGGRTLNAFDLVRIHLYGDRDDNVQPTTNITKYPSYLAMEDLCSADKEVRRTIAEEKLKDAGEDFADIITEENKEWLEKLETDKKGNYLTTYNNIRLILENDPKLKGCFAFDEFLEKSVILRRPPWRKETDNERFIRDDDECGLRIYLGEDPWCIEAKQKISDALNAICRANAFHPVKQYLDGLLWDGTPRLDTIFIDFNGAEDTPLNRMMTRIMFVAAVTRIYKPGTKFDQMLILVGKQGCGKSEILKRMAVNESWFTDAMPSPEDPKNAAEHLLGKWIIEMGELVAMKKATAEANKSFISRTSDKFRAAYAKNETFRLRQCVFFGTTNEQQFLRDSTGERRYWPIQVGVTDKMRSIDKELTRDLINQYWAEALEYYSKGYDLKLPKEMQQDITETQEEYKEEDEWYGIIEAFLQVRLPANWSVVGIDQRRDYFLSDNDITRPAGTIQRDKVCIAEIINECPYLNIKGTVTQFDRNRIGSILRKMRGWIYRKVGVNFGPYGRQKYFSKVNIEAKDPIY